MRFAKKSRKHCLLIILVALAMAGSATLAAVALFEAPWWSADGGGARFLSGGAYALSATAGQPDAGRLSGGPFVLHGGYWAASLPIGPTRATHWEQYR